MALLSLMLQRQPPKAPHDQKEVHKRSVVCICVCGVCVDECAWLCVGRVGGVCGYRRRMYVCNVYGNVYKCCVGVGVCAHMGGWCAGMVCVCVCMHRGVHEWVCV